MQWEEDELRPIKVGLIKRVKSDDMCPPTYKTTWSGKEIPAAYTRIISQLEMEIEHTKTHKGHEALRRDSYARAMLDLLGKEIKAYKGNWTAFRSKVLGPVLLRNLYGCPDAYGPVVREFIKSREDKDDEDQDDDDQDDITIALATEFYLTHDATHPKYIPNFRRNLVLIPEMRWHLSVLMNNIKLGDETSYNRIRDGHDTLMDRMRKKVVADPVEEGTIPPFSKAEVKTIVDDRLEAFFELELQRVVSLTPPHPIPPIHFEHRKRRTTRA